MGLDGTKMLLGRKQQERSFCETGDAIMKLCAAAADWLVQLSCIVGIAVVIDGIDLKNRSVSPRRYDNCFPAC